MTLYYTNNCIKWFPGLPPFNLILTFPHHSTIIHTWLTSNDISFLISIHKLPLPQHFPATTVTFTTFFADLIITGILAVRMKISEQIMQ